MRDATFTDAAFTNAAVLAFVLLPLLLALALAWGIFKAWRLSGAPAAGAARAAGWSLAAALLWMAVTSLVAASGVLREWDRTPPPFALLVAAIFTLGAGLAFSGAGRRLAVLPLWALVAVQGFRLPLELAMHAMAERGVMPETMSYTGRNFDIVTGITAIVVAAAVAAGVAGRRTVLLWNWLGLALLGNIIGVAILATPRFRYFGDDQLNIWVTYPPFVWLPAVMVLAALAGHLIVFRALRRQR